MAKKESKKQLFLGFTPHSGQQKIINSVLNDPYKFYCLCMGRSWGKTQLCINLMLYWGINQKDCDILYLSPTFRLAKDVFGQIVEAIKDSGVIGHLNKTDLVITLVNGSKITFGSGENYNAWRGRNTLTHCIIDEMCYQHPDLFRKVIYSCLLARGQKCMLISTPNGFDFFKDEWDKGNNKVADYISFQAPSTENPYIDFSELEYYKEHSPVIYKSEYLAEFVDEYVGVFSNVRECIYGQLEDTPKPNTNYICGLDLGRRDATVFIVLDAEQNKIVDILRLQNTSWERVIDEVAEMYHKWKPIGGYAECNFNDRLVEELVKDKGCVNLKPYYTLSHTKQPMIENLILNFSKREIKIPDDPQLIKELRAYAIRFKGDSKKPTYSGGQVNDDMVMSLALASIYRKEKYKGGRSIFWEPL